MSMLIGVVAVIVLSALAATAGKTVTATLAEAASRVVTLGIVFVGMLWIVPQHAKIYDDFDIAMPFLTDCVASVSGVMARYVFLAVPLLCGAALGVVYAFHALHRDASTRRLAQEVSVITTVGLLSGVVPAFVGVLQGVAAVMAKAA
jgi:type II secretory pathway component PulF